MNNKRKRKTKQNKKKETSDMRLKGRDDGDSVTSVQYKSNWGCHNETPPCHEYILIKIY
jgi:hypothetical protein